VSRASDPADGVLRCIPRICTKKDFTFSKKTFGTPTFYCNVGDSHIEGSRVDEVLQHRVLQTLEWHRATVRRSFVDKVKFETSSPTRELFVGIRAAATAIVSPRCLLHLQYVLATRITGERGERPSNAAPPPGLPLQPILHRPINPSFSSRCTQAVSVSDTCRCNKRWSHQIRSPPTTHRMPPLLTSAHCSVLSVLT
jgi:hypothetical protein